MKKIAWCVLCVLISTILCSSSTHSSILLHYFSLPSLQASYSGLWPAAKNGSQQALTVLSKRAAQHKDEYWLIKAASLNNLTAQLALADLNTGTSKENWWRQAAKNGHAPSQFELSLVVDSPAQRLSFLEASALGNYAPAVIALGKHYYETNQIDKALKWLSKASVLDKRSTLKLARMQWLHGQKEAATASFKIAAEDLVEARMSLRAIQSLKRKTIDSLAIDYTTEYQSNLACAQSLQFVATTLDTAVQAIKFKDKFEQDIRLTSLPICIEPIVWLKPNQLQCTESNSRKNCDLSKIAEQKFTPKYTHIVLFLENGKAYVYNGVMYLDKVDTYSVFVHELAHFAGFVDEYQVSPDLAENYCQSGNAGGALNLAIATNDEIYTHPRYLFWKRQNKRINDKKAHELPTQPYIISIESREDNAKANKSTDDYEPSLLQISPSNTCKKLGVQAYKPSSSITFMEFHDVENIPELYRYMWLERLEQTAKEVAIADAFAQYAADTGNQLQMLYWRSM